MIYVVCEKERKREKKLGAKGFAAEFLLILKRNSTVKTQTIANK